MRQEFFLNKTVFITGASSGIGEALAREFSLCGANLVLTARREERLQTLANEFKPNGTRTLVTPCDVTQDGDLERAVKLAVTAHPGLDVVIANAGFGIVGDLENLSLNDYRRQFETNVFGVLRTVYATLDELKKSKGTLVLIGSIAGTISVPGGTPYAMSKFAVHALAQAIRHELKPQGISVVLIAPGFVESEFRQVDNQGKLRINASDDVPSFLIMPTQKAARQILKAIARRRSFQIITLHGKILVWIQRHCPWVLSLLFGRGLKSRSEPKVINGKTHHR